MISIRLIVKMNHAPVIQGYLARCNNLIFMLMGELYLASNDTDSQGMSVFLYIDT